MKNITAEKKIKSFKVTLCKENYISIVSNFDGSERKVYLRCQEIINRSIEELKRKDPNNEILKKEIKRIEMSVDDLPKIVENICSTCKNFNKNKVLYEHKPTKLEALL